MMGSGGIDLSATTTNEVLYIGFNQDQSCFAVGTTTGFKVFNCSPFKEVRGESAGEKARVLL